MRATLPAILFLAATSCSGDPVVAAARRVFERYQDALFAGDRPALRQLLASDSRQVVPRLPLERLHGQQRLQIGRIRRLDPEVYVSVRDPNHGGATSTYVLVRQDGQLRVDLIATTGLNHVDVPGTNRGPTLVTRPLRPEERAEIGSYPGRPIR